MEHAAEIIAREDDDAFPRDLLEWVPHLAFTCDAHGAVDYINRRWVEYTGASVGASLGYGWLDAIHPDERAATHAAWKAAVAADRELRVAHRMRGADGAYRWFEARVAPVRLGGRTVRWIGTTTDIHEQRTLREQLGEQVERFEDLAASVPGMLSVINVAADGALSVPFASPTALHALFGIGPDDDIAAAFRARIPAEDLARLEGHLRGPSAPGRWQVEFRYQHPARGERWFELVGTGRATSDGQLRWACVTLEITERKGTERRLALQHAVAAVLSTATSLPGAAPALMRELALVEDAAMGTLWLVDRDAGVLRCAGQYAAPAFADSPYALDSRQRAFGRGVGLPGEVWDTGRAMIVAVETLSAARYPRAELGRAAGARCAMVFPITGHERVLGAIELVLMHPHPPDPQLEQAFDAVGRQIGVFLERMRAAEDIARSEARLQSVIESMSEGVVLADESGRVLHWNPAALDMHGFASAEGWLRLLPEFTRYFELSTLAGEVLPVTEWPMARVLRGERLRNVELRVRRLDADWERICAYGGARVTQADGSALVVVTIADVTPRARASEALQRLNATLEERVAERTAALEQANEELEAFTYSVSHDLRAPLRAVNGFADILLQDHEPELSTEARRLARTIRASGERMATLINDLLALSRYGRMALRRRPLDMAQLARDALAEIGQADELERYQITIAQLPTADGDASLVKQIWINLLSNAVKYSRLRAAPRIEVGCEDDGQAVTYLVRDNGTGFAMSDAHRLFGLFQRLHPADQYEGTGVGLALVQRLVHRHGGRVWAESEVDRGATFRFTLPRRS